MDVLADVLDAMEAGEAEEALGEIVERTVSSCEEEEEKMDCGKARSWYVRLWGRVVAADISSDEHRSAVRYDCTQASLDFCDHLIMWHIGFCQSLDFVTALPPMSKLW